MDDFNFLNTFELLYSQNANNAPGLDDDEILIFLNQAQIKLWEQYVVAFDINESARLVLDKLISKNSIALINDIDAQDYFISASRVVSDINDNINIFTIGPYKLISNKNVVYENLVINITDPSLKTTNFNVNVIPLNFDYKYQFLTLNPFRIPNKKLAYRCKDILYVNNFYEKSFVNKIDKLSITYQWEHINMPSNIDIVNNKCDLNDTVWYKIVEMAVALAQQTMLTRQTNN